jgi:glycosyltransferase involved in cell wall biosynthesis
MKILSLHNAYRQPGGEDVVFESEARLLRERGHEVAEIRVDNNDAGLTRIRPLQRAGRLAFSEESFEMVRAACKEFRPDVAHVHNFWMKLTPSVHAACHSEGVATVQTLHNYRLLCPNALLLRNGRVCEDCVGKTPWRGVLRRCYRGSIAASAAVAGMIVHNRRRRTWDEDVDQFIALTEFSRKKFIEGGLPAHKIAVKPNFTRDAGRSNVLPSSSDLMLFVGRLSAEKGVGSLLGGWARAGLMNYGRLCILGDGPERRNLEKRAEALGLFADRVTFLGNRSRSEVLEWMSHARAVVAPSVWYENFPMVVVESLMLGRPVIASDLGALREIVREYEVGLRFTPGDAVDLGYTMRKLLIDGKLADLLGAQAREAYLERYTPEQNYTALMNIYQTAMERQGVPSLPATQERYA